MNVQLTPELERLVLKKLKTGRHSSASEVVRDALRLMEERDQTRELRTKEIRQQIQEGWNSLRRGQCVDGEEFLNELDAELRRKTAATGKKRPR